MIQFKHQCRNDTTIFWQTKSTCNSVVISPFRIFAAWQTFIYTTRPIMGITTTMRSIFSTQNLSQMS